MIQELWNRLRGKDATEFEGQNDQLIKVYPVSARDGRRCTSEPWGANGSRVCPFLRSGNCRLWGWDLRRRPDKADTCPVTDVYIPLPDD